MVERNTNQVLCADDAVVVVESEEILRQLVEEFGKVCEKGN